MQQAQQKLEKNDAKQAQKDQEEAIRQLEQARQEIEDRLAQLRREMQDEMLANLEMRFRQMLDLQTPLTEYSGALLDVDGAWSAKEYRIGLPSRASDQRAIAAMAQQALDIIEEDGTTVILPQIVGQLRDDMIAASTMLKKLAEMGERRARLRDASRKALTKDIDRTLGYTHQMQQEIEQTLKELIEALEKAQQQQQGGQGQGQGQQSPGQEQREPLVPDSAELKLLKAAQLRVNGRTKRFDSQRGERLDEIQESEIDRIAGQQEGVAEMAEDMIERN